MARIRWSHVGLLLLILAPSALAKAVEAPKAAEVIARGSQDLAHALEVAGHPAWTDASRPVAIVVDVTENTRRQRGALATALGTLAPRAAGAESWRIGPLGERPGKTTSTPNGLVNQLDDVLAKDTPTTSTIKALRKSIRAAPKDAVVIYLADWRFEDDTGLEELISDLEANRRTLSVVGSEAAFGRAWNDGIRDGMDRMSSDSMEQDLYDEGIGRNPFGPIDHVEPWHGGDTAYPTVPYRFAHRWWRTQFSPGELESSGQAFALGDMEDAIEKLKQGGNLEDLKKRLPGFVAKSEGGASFRQIPLPSAFGPYGLMRAAGASGGRYVLWSWNPSGRASVTYDFSRCNTFGPDLRPRAKIRSDAGRDGLQRAMLKAWHALLDVDGELIEMTSPLKKSATPQEIEVIEPSGSFGFSWRDRQEWKTFIRLAGYALESLDDAASSLDRALEKADKDALPTRRYVADARLFRHIVRVLQFQVGEAVAVAKEVPKEAWKDDETYPGIRPETWIQPGNDPENVRTSDVEIQDAGAGQTMLGARKAMLREFGKTPSGELVGLNGVNTFRPTRMKKMDPSDFKGSTGRSPAESSGDRPTTPKRPPGPSSGSGGGGPSTGK